MKHLQGRALVIAMCIGQIGNLLPHVVVPAIMAQHLIPLWGLSATQAGLMASAYAVGYMLSVPVLTALTDRFDARGILFAGSLVSGLRQSRSVCLRTAWRQRSFSGVSRAPVSAAPICRA